jgi:uncharacterized protein (TIGR02246 family)
MLAACQAGPERVLLDWTAAMNRADADAAIACHADRAVWLRPETAPVEGKDAIAQQCRNLFASGTCTMQWTLEEVQVDGDRALLRGRLDSALAASPGNSAVHRQERLSAVLRRENNRWRIVQLSWQA